MSFFSTIGKIAKTAVGFVPGIGSAVSSVLDMLPGIGSSIDSHNQYTSQRDDALAATRMQMAFNSSEADKQRAFTKASIEDARNYNSPASVMARLTAAGLNPNLVAGSVDSGSSLASTGGNSAASASLPSFHAYDPNVRLMEAQAGLLESQTRKTDEETGIASTYQEFQRQLLSGEVRMQNMNLEVGQSVKDMNEAQKQKFYKDCDMIDAQIPVVQQNFRKAEAEADMAQIDRRFRAAMNFLEMNKKSAQIDNINENTELTKEQKRWCRTYAEAAMLSALAAQRSSKAAMTAAYAQAVNVGNQANYWEELGKLTGVNADVAAAVQGFTQKTIEVTTKTIETNLEMLTDWKGLWMFSEICKNLGIAAGSLLMFKSPKMAEKLENPTPMPTGSINNW